MIRLILFAALLLVTSCRLPKQITGMKEGDNTDVKKNPDVENSSKKKPGHEIFKGLFFMTRTGNHSETAPTLIQFMTLQIRQEN